METYTRQQIIDLVEQYIYTNGMQRITASQLSEILMAIANAFAMEGSSGAGIDAVLEEGPLVSNGREITNSSGGKINLAAQYPAGDFTYHYIGFSNESPDFESMTINGIQSSLMTNLKRTDPTHNFFTMFGKDQLDPGEVISTKGFAAMGTKSESINDGAYGIVSSENGKNTHSVRPNNIDSEVRMNDGYVSSTKQYSDSIQQSVVNGPQGSVHSMATTNIEKIIYASRSQFSAHLRSSFEFWSNNSSTGIFYVKNEGISIQESRKLVLTPGGTSPTAGRATLSGGSMTVFTTAVKANSIISLSVQETGTFTGNIRISAKTAGTSFTIASSVNTDTCIVFWQIIDLITDADFSEFSDEFGYEYY